MLKKIISVLILSVILVSSFDVIAFADDGIYPYSDTSVISISREEFLTIYAEQLGLSPDGSEIPEDDYIYLVRNELGDYGELIRQDTEGRMLISYEIRFTLGLDVEIDFKTMKKVGFLSNPLELLFLHPESNIIGAFEYYTNNDLNYPTTDGSCSDPLVTEFFIFSKTENFSGVASVSTIIENRYNRKLITENYSSEINYYVEPHRILIDGEPSTTVTFGEGGTTHTVTYLDTDGNVLWETFVPTGVRAPRLLLKLDKKARPGAKYVFAGWENYSFDSVTEDITYTVEYAIETDPRGDINDDGVVNTKDVVQILKGLKSGGSGLDKERADVNLDGTVGYDDVTYMLEAFTEAREW